MIAMFPECASLLPGYACCNLTEAISVVEHLHSAQCASLIGALRSAPYAGCLKAEAEDCLGETDTIDRQAVPLRHDHLASGPGA